MPKATLTEAQRRKARAMEADKTLRRHVGAYLMERSMTQKMLAERIGMSPITLSRRLAKPESLTIAEFRQLSQVLELTDEETAQCV